MNVQACSWLHCPSESGVVDSRESVESIGAHDFFGVKRTELRRSFDHHDAWKKRSSRNVPENPKLIICDVANADDKLFFAVQHCDSRELLELESLKIDFADVFDGVLNLVEVELADIEEQFRRHGFLRSRSLRCTRFAGGRITLSNVRFAGVS